MLEVVGNLFNGRSSSAPWDSAAPVRDELFGVERLEQHAESLAAAQSVTDRPLFVRSLRVRLNDNAARLLAAYKASAAELESGGGVTPAAEWLLDNYHLVEDQVREIREDLPPGYYRQLPKLSGGPFRGYPRVFGLAWAYVAHTDSHFDPEILKRFVAAYQGVQPLTMGELWAVAITIRIVLIENLRRLADQISVARAARADADLLADRLLASGGARSALETDIATRATGPVSELFAAQLAKRLRDQDPRTNPALEWLDRRMTLQGSSIEEAIRHAQMRQGASNLTIRNVITSMRLISDIDWAELFEAVSLVDEKLRRSSDFAAMDFPTRNLYRSAIEQLSRGSLASELVVADAALAASRREGPTDAPGTQRVRDPGYHLIAEGRLDLERALDFRASPRLWFNRLSIRLGVAGYLGAILALTAALLGGAVSALIAAGGGTTWPAVIALLGFIPATDVATALVNRLIGWSFGAHPLPGLDLSAGVPSEFRTLVAIPTLLTGEADLAEQIAHLEVHHLSGAGGDISFALVVDGVDADRETLRTDAALLAIASSAIARLNAKHGPAPGGDRFLLLHRRRVFNSVDGVWMAWERKRGKLHELNRLLRGATDTTFTRVDERAPRVPADVRYVITLDADTRLPRDAASRLIGKMAHPLNRPNFDAHRQRVVAGYGILQPRVTPSLPIGREGSVYQRAFSAPGGIDPYAAAISDVYQDLFGEGSYTGKGIYDVDAFEAALAGRTPENAMLSHDLFEGVFARAGLASDVEVIEDFPSRYDVAARRQHRWMRGDWQLLPLVLGALGGPGALSPVGRVKMLDNLRRSLVAPAALATLAACWLAPPPAAAWGALFLVLALVLPGALHLFFSVVPRRAGIQLAAHNRALLSDLRLAATQIGLSLAFLPDQAWRAGDAIGRTIDRVFRTRRRLLEWTTAAQSTAAPRLTLAGFYRMMAGGVALGLGLAGLCLVLAPASWALILPFAVAWGAAPAIALWASRSPDAATDLALSPDDALELRLIARRTWRFFETFVTPADNMLPPDNFQEDPHPVIARRTSPTNIGLYLLSAVAARDFGWAGTTETLDRLEATFASLKTLQRHRGHFLNWYGTENGEPLIPAYVSTVDSGNLAGHLIALANACEDWPAEPVALFARQGLADSLALARRTLTKLVSGNKAQTRPISEIIDEIDAQLNGGVPISTLAPALMRLSDKTLKIARGVLPPIASEGAADFQFWITAFMRGVTEHARDAGCDRTALPLRERAARIAVEARATALAMDFAFLLDPERKLFSIGYSLPDNRLDPSCYDLLASEARLASLFAIAKGDAPTRHWFRLGRTATPTGGASALLSWSGSMFEYLMPSLVMRAPAGSLLEQTNRLIVRRQQDYGRSLGVPWGVSESAYNARDLEFTYQYSNFGVPGLGLKRGLAENAVFAPYATALAAMVDPQGALANFTRLAAIGASGRYGFYDAIDFTRGRLPAGENVAIVRTFMAHHQGMTIVSLANVLQDGRMRARFHREPMIEACDSLMQERVPRDVAVLQPRAEEVRASPGDLTEASVVRHVTPATGGAPVTHLLSNGRYAVMLSADGGGYSRWRDLAVTRWRGDATRDDLGSFVMLRDVASGRIWSATAQPLGAPADQQEVVFAEDQASFIRRDGPLTTTVEVIVSGEVDAEVRRVTLTNAGRTAFEIELTSYSEIVLGPQAADAAHPAFAKLFVVTEHLPEFGALVATRRPRANGEATPWAAHFAVIEGAESAEPQYESDRAKFLGRGLPNPAAFACNAARPLSNTAGTVLDPVFSIRRRVVVPSGAQVRVAFWTVVAATRADLLDLVDAHHDRSAFERAKTLAWTQAQVQLRHLDVTADEAADFQRLAAPLLYPDARFRAASDVILGGAGPQSGLWPYSISGDLPIVLLRIDDVEDINQVRQLLRAIEYWRMKRLSVDLVIINEHASSYLQDLQIAIDTAVRSSQSRPRSGDAPAQGDVYTLRADLLPIEARNLLLSVARVVLVARRGPIAAQMERLPAAAPLAAPRPRKTPATKSTETQRGRATDDLEFFNGLGGFGDGGREYVVVLDGGQTTPAPWINVIANPAFGFQASAGGSGSTWSENSRENQLTPWSNDPVMDPVGEAMYVRDEVTRDVWTPTAQPICDGGLYVARHRFGSTRFEHEANGVALALTQFVPVADPIKISRLTLRNTSGRPRRLSVTAFAEWALGTAREASAPFVVTSVDPETGALFARNRWRSAFPDRVAFADLLGRQTSWTSDRTEFLGRNGGPEAPAALFRESCLSGAAGAGLDPCAALSTDVALGVGESVEIVWLLGQCRSEEEARACLVRTRAADIDAMLMVVSQSWARRLGAVQVRTPDRAMDIMLNGWLLYQALGCRIWARSGFYQASGAYGFRDQMQDGMALSLIDPAETRRHLLRAAGRQFPEGDVQHWWLPHSGQGVRTRISDDRVWLAYAAATYVATSGDAAVLEEETNFLEGPLLKAGEHDAFFQPMESAQRASLFEHCARGLDQCVELTGPHGLPLMGTGDWNDGMNRVGEGGRGESVWLGWLFIRSVELFAPHSDARAPDRAARWRAHAENVRAAIEREAWDGAWYRRATFDDGAWLGSATSDECRIDQIAQSWAVLSGAADPERATRAMASVDERLIRREDGVAALFTPPFVSTPRDPGYIKGYPAGLRENGGQYSHAAMWSVLAFAKLGDGAKAHDLFAMLNPINHALDAELVERYKVEPYVVAADVYSVAPHVGRGGWTWYTGSAAWMYRAGLEGILGVTREASHLRVAPVVPPSWPGFEATLSVEGTVCRVRVERLPPGLRQASHTLDGSTLELTAEGVRIPLDAQEHDLTLCLPRGAA
ncbi:GH36-type glycosyl hydrolase domain-containing protein [Hansschlegelia beijingensis]|uniref:Cyclic beta-1,2-glucan synthetase n=1 Tax=Hansschlegelia beijingensis TaxID=1133344 RepID=A0A7W6D0J9_9HYPH|nr:glucoamylase family protein [Hansschlegelia beijingensis]MBB3971862.1 cyclic beta-1,2-glucan synthetase [Hansschlegelia beijingensis]